MPLCSAIQLNRFVYRKRIFDLLEFVFRVLIIFHSISIAIQSNMENYFNELMHRMRSSAALICEYFLNSVDSIMSSKGFGDLIGSIDEGTSSARFVLFKAGTADVVCFHQLELRQITPAEGWVEQDACEILRVVEECIEKTVEKLVALGGSASVSVSDRMNFIQLILCD